MTLSDMAQQVYAIIGIDTRRRRVYITDAEIVRLFNQAIRHMCLLGKVNAKTASITVSNGDADYSVPAGGIKVFNVLNKDGVALNEIEPKDVGKLFVEVGDPMWWYELGGMIYLVPTPTTGFAGTFTVQYFALAADLTIGTPSGVPDLPEEYHAGIVAYAVSDIYRRMGNLAMANSYAAEFGTFAKIGFQEAMALLGLKEQQTEPSRR